MSDTEKLMELEKAIENISRMPLVKGIGSLENLYNSIVVLAKETYDKTRD